MEIDFTDVNINEYIVVLRELAEEAQRLGLNDELECLLDFWKVANGKSDEIKIPWKQ
jgi:hypothetical protein